MCEVADEILDSNLRKRDPELKDAKMPGFEALRGRNVPVPLLFDFLERWVARDLVAPFF